MRVYLCDSGYLTCSQSTSATIFSTPSGPSSIGVAQSSLSMVHKHHLRPLTRIAFSDFLLPKFQTRRSKQPLILS